MDMGWLSQEAKQIHGIFAGLFYSVVLLLLLFGVVINFFKMSVGDTPAFVQLVGRAALAALLLSALPEIMNVAADVTDQLAKEVGHLDNYKLLIHRLGEKIGTLSLSWVSVKDSLLVLVSYTTYILVYVSVYLADAMFLYAWTLLYVFSPLLMAAFVLPPLAGATKGYFTTLLEICLWKVMWAILAALLWSYGLSQINQPNYGVDFLTAVLLNLMLALSVVCTPLLVRGLLRGSMSQAATMAGGVILAAAGMTPAELMNVMKMKKLRGSISRGLKSDKKKGSDDEDEEGCDEGPQRSVEPRKT